MTKSSCSEEDPSSNDGRAERDSDDRERSSCHVFDLFFSLLGDLGSVVLHPPWVRRIWCCLFFVVAIWGWSNASSFAGVGSLFFSRFRFQLCLLSCCCSVSNFFFLFLCLFRGGGGLLFRPDLGWRTTIVVVVCVLCGSGVLSFRRQFYSDYSVSAVVQLRSPCCSSLWWFGILLRSWFSPGLGVGGRRHRMIVVVISVG
jgi:hypothetical protein